MAERGTKIWLYWHPDGRLVGYASLGVTDWKIPPPHGDSIRVAIIPFFGVQKQFWGEPQEGDSFSVQIMKAILAKAREMNDSADLVLYVDPENERARRFYSKFDFEEYPQEPSAPNIQMHRPIR